MVSWVNRLIPWSNMLEADLELDVTGLSCPMPLLKAKLALNELVPLQILKVVATDPASEEDFYLFIERSDHQILEFEKGEDAYTFYIQRG